MLRICLPCCVFINRIYLFCKKKLARRKREEKSLACGPNHLSDVVWARIRQPYLPCHAFLQLNLLLCKTLVRMKRKMKNTCLRPKGRVWRRLGPICHCLGSFIRIADRWWFVGLLAWSQPLVVEGEVRKGRVSWINNKFNIDHVTCWGSAQMTWAKNKLILFSLSDILAPRLFFFLSYLLY